MTKDEAIELLEDLNGAIEDNHGRDYDEAFRMAIESLSAESEWIPCSERLPSEEDCPMDCMVTRYSEQIGAYVDMAVCERDGTWTHEDWDAIVLGDVESGRKTGLMNTHDHPILAWMPLPKQYGERREPCD